MPDDVCYSHHLLSKLLQSTIQQFQPVLTPKYLAGRQHVTRCTEDACRQRFLRILIMQVVEFGVQRAVRT